MDIAERRVLIIPSWYPTVASPLRASFLREQAQLLARTANVRVLVPMLQSTRAYWRGEAEEGCLPIQGPPAFLVRARTNRFASWRRRIDSQVGALGRALIAFRKEGWVPDVVLAHTTAWAGVLSTLMALHFKVPVVIIEHSGYHQYPSEQQEIIKQALGRAAVVACVSPSLRRAMLAHDLPDSIEWAIVGNLVDESVFYADTSMNRTVSDLRRILIVASRSFQKDVRTCFQAAAIIRQTRPGLDFEVLAVGDSAEGQAMTFAELASECGIQGLVRTVGQLGRHEIAVAMRSADLLVSSSVSETFGIVIAEALACGTPVVATRSGGAEYILGEDSPLLVEVRDPKALAARILDVLDGDVSFDAGGASRDVVRRFGRSAYSSRLTAILERAIVNSSRNDLASACLPRGSSALLGGVP